jgi:hypothetical protein
MAIFLGSLKIRLNNLQRRNKLTPLGFDGLPLVGPGSRSSVQICRLDPIYDTQPPILPLITGGGPSLNKTNRSYRMC